MLTDSHAHLDFPDFARDFEAVRSRAEAAGIHRIITIGTSLAGSREALALAERYPEVHAVIGIHPNSAHEAEPGDVEALRALADSERVAAIGEAGLDYYWLPGAVARRKGGTPEEVEALAGRDAELKVRQAEIFRLQLELAAELKLNVVVHQRASWDDTLEILRPFDGRLRAVFHCFGEPPARAEEVLAAGHLISFTGIVTFRNAPAAQASAAMVPAGRYMVETDSPYLAPEPNRGKRCEPAFVRQVAEKVAALRGVPLAEVARETEETVHSFFRLHAAV
jgi:TatD DNase family protein